MLNLVFMISEMWMVDRGWGGEGGQGGGKGGECRDRLRWPSSDAIMNLVCRCCKHILELASHIQQTQC